jgi:hypothetical protein
MWPGGISSAVVSSLIELVFFATVCVPPPTSP